MKPMRFSLCLTAVLLLPGLVSKAIASKPPLQQEPTQVGPGWQMESELKGGETQSFAIALTTEQFLYVIVDQKGIDIVATLVGPSGQVVVKVDSPNSAWGPEPLVTIAEASGNYRIEVSSTNKSGRQGRFELKVVAVRKATPGDRDHVAADRTFWEANRLRLQRTATSSRQAIEKYKRALTYFQHAEEHYREALTLTLIGSIHAGLGEFQSALESHEQALPHFRILGDRIGASGALTNIGGMHDVLGDLPKALTCYTEALSLLAKGRAPITEGAILSNIGKVHSDLSNWHESLEYYHQALSRFREVGEKRREGITLNNIGTTYSMLGQPDKALEYFQQAVTLRRSAGDKAGEAQTLTNIGRVYVEMAQAPKAIQHYNEALVLQRAVGDRLGEGNTLNQLGIAYSALEEHQQALEFHQQSLDLGRAVGNRREEGIALNNLGRVSRILAQLRIALDYHNQALRIFRDIGDRLHEANALYGLARTESDFGNYNQAGHYLTAALSLFEGVRANVGAGQLRATYLASKQDVYKFYIDLLMRMHALEPTKGYDALALQTSERARARSLLEMLAEARADIRQGVDKALLERERTLMQQLNAKAQRQMQLLGQKDSLERLSELNKQLSALEDEYRLVQATLRKSSPAYAALTQPQPLGLKEIQQQLDPGTLLLEYALGDQRSYLWAVSANSFKAYDLPPREIIRKSARRVYELLTARSSSKTGETAEQKHGRLSHADFELRAATMELSSMVLGPVAAELGNKRLVVIADDALQYVPFAALPVVRSPLSLVSSTRSTSPRSSPNEPSTTDHKPPSTAKYRPLILDHEVITLPSASVLAVQRNNLVDRKPAPKAVAVIADPVFSIADDRLNAKVRNVEGEKTQGDDSAGTRILEHLADDSTGKLAIRRLRFTRQEADQILAVAPRTSNLRALDFKASRATATGANLSQYRYVHFATHGYLDSERADLSAVVLSMVDEQGNPQDGFLRAHEIYNLNLPAELVVLSACQTGLGKEIKGEGLVGLTRGFMYAGARRVVVSLWNVNDRATAELMRRFYRGMLLDKLTPAAALRRAQAEMSRHPQWHSPYYWSAFVLQGEWK